MTQQKQTITRGELSLENDELEIEVIDVAPEWRDTADTGDYSRRVVIVRPLLNEPGLTELFDREFNINDYFNDSTHTADEERDRVPRAFLDLLKEPINSGKFPAEGERFDNLIKTVLSRMDATAAEFRAEIRKIGDVFNYFYVLMDLDDVAAAEYIQQRLTLAREGALFEDKLKALFAEAITNDPELIDLIQRVAPKYRAYMLVDLLQEALTDPDARFNIIHAYKTDSDYIREIETNAAELAELARDPDILADPSKCPRIFIYDAVVWDYSHREQTPDSPAYYNRVVAGTIATVKGEFYEILENADRFGPEKLDELATETGFIDLMDAAREWAIVKARYARLKPTAGTYRRVFTRVNPAGMSDIIASNSWIYRKAGLMSLDQWQGYNPKKGEYSDGAVLIPPTGTNVNERLTLKYTPRPWDRFVMMVYDAIASIYFNSDQWDDRTTEYPIVPISFFALRETVAPEYFRLVSKKGNVSETYERGKLSTGQDNRALMDDIRDAVNVLMESVIRIHHNSEFKQKYHDEDEDAIYSSLEQDLNAIYAFYSTFQAKNGENTEGITLIAPPILPYECLRMNQTVNVPRADYLTSSEYAHYLKAEYGIDSINLSEYAGPYKSEQFIVIRNSTQAMRVKGAIVTAYRRLADHVAKHGIADAEKKGLTVFNWERDLYPAVFGTITAPEWEPGKERPQAETINYNDIPRKQRVQVKRIALAVLSNLSNTDNARDTVVGITHRDKYGTGIKFKPLAVDDEKPRPDKPKRQIALDAYR